MKLLRTLVLINQGNVISSSDWKKMYQSYARAIKSIDHPLGSGKLSLRSKPDFQVVNGKETGLDFYVLASLKI